LRTLDGDPQSFIPKPLSFYATFGCTYETHSRASTEMYVFLAKDIVLLRKLREKLNVRLESSLRNK